MNKKLLAALIAMLAVGLIAAGCGDDEDEGSSDEPVAEATTTEETTEAPDTGNEEVDVAIEDAIQQCKDTVAQVPNLQPDTVEELEGICEDAGNGDETDIAQATKDVCVAIVEDTVPEGPGREPALQACESAAPTP